MTLSNGKKLALILIVSVLLRMGAAVYLGNTVVDVPGAFDQVSYHNLALRVLGGHGFTFDRAWWPATPAGEPTAHWSYLYTMYLVVVYGLFGANPIVARLIQAAAVGILQPLLAYHLARQVVRAARGNWLSAPWMERIPLLAAGITAVYIYFVYYAGTLMTEPLYIVMLLASMYFTMLLVQRLDTPRFWQTALGLGAVVGTVVLLRQLFMLILPFYFLWVLVLAWRQKTVVRAVTALGIVVIVLIAMIAPVTYFNSTRFNTSVLVNTNSGYAFFWGNHPIHGTRFIAAHEMGDGYVELIPDELRSLDEAELDKALLDLGVEFVMEDPGRYVLLSLSRIPPYFKFWPEATSSPISNISRVGSFGLFLPFMIYGVVRSFVRVANGKRRLIWPVAPSFLMFLFAGAYTGMHVLTWTLIRYRLPVDAVLVIFAAVAIAELSGVLETRWQRVNGRSVSVDVSS